MPNININVENRIATAQGDPRIICGNGDYTVTFTFDEEWERYPAKTVRVSYWKNGLHLHAPDIQFTGNTAALPALYGIGEAEIGVYVGNIKTTTPARIPCAPCITDDEPQHADPPPDVYEQLLEYLNEIASGGAAPSGQIVIRLSGAAGGIGGQAVVTETEEENGS